MSVRAGARCRSASGSSDSAGRVGQRLPGCGPGGHARRRSRATPAPGSHGVGRERGQCFQRSCPAPAVMSDAESRTRERPRCAGPSDAPKRTRTSTRLAWTRPSTWPAQAGQAPPATASMSGTRTSLTRGRPAGAPRARSCPSIASQPRHVTSPGHPRPQPSLDAVAAAAPAARQPAVREVVQQPADGVGGALLVRADHPRRPALDPADGVLAHARRAVPARTRGRPRCGSGRGARRTGRRAADGRGSRSSGSPARRGSPRDHRSRPRARRRADPARAGCARPARRSPARRRPRRGSRPASGRSAA